MSSGSDRVPCESWYDLCCCYRCSNISRMSSWFARLSLIFMGTFACSLRAYSISAGEGSWLSMGRKSDDQHCHRHVHFRRAGLLQCSFNSPTLYLDKSIRLGEMRAGCCVIKLPLLAKSSIFNAAILTTIVAVVGRRDTLLGEYIFRQSDDGLTGHCSSHILHKGELGVIFRDD